MGFDPEINEQRIQDKIDLWRKGQPNRTKVSADKTGGTITNPIDNQIENGVDFFDDNTSSHTGFVPKTDLASRYHQMKGATISSAWPDAARTNTKTRSAYGENGEYGELPNVGISSQSHIIDGDVVVGVRNHNGSYYADLIPIENRNSMYRRESSYTFNQWGTIPTGTESEIIYPPFDISTQTTLYGIQNLQDGGQWTIDTQPGGFSFDNPVVNANVDFMITPISGYVSYLNNNNSTDTHNVLAISSPNAVASTMMGTTAKYQGSSNLGPFINTFDSQYIGATGESSTLSQLWDTTIRTNLLSYGSDAPGKKDGIFQFNNVPNGLNENNLFSTTLMRMVSNKGPFEGNATHPILIRSYDNNWSDELPKSEYGLKDEYDNAFGYLSDIQINMSAASYYRINVWSQTTAGSVWFTQQENLQKLNPTFETRGFHQNSILGGIGGAKGLFYQHKTRHKDTDDNGNRYEKLLNGKTTPKFIQDNPNVSRFDLLTQKFGFGSRIAMQGNYDINPDVSLSLSIFGITAGFEAGNPALPLANGIFFSNPNRYTGELSSAPVTIVDGIPSFTKNAGTGEGSTAKSDADKILNTQGGTFNKEAHSYDSTRSNIAQKYASLAYGRLNNLHSYEKTLKSPAELIGFLEDGDISPGSIFPSATLTGEIFGIDYTATLGDVPSTHNVARRRKEKEINDAVGNAGVEGKVGVPTIDPKLGVVKKSTYGSGFSAGAYDGTDKINMTPYGADVDGENVKYSNSLTAKDFIKFRFFDVVNNKYIIFRAILSGIQDTIQTDYGEEKYIGRPDKLYIYKGADRDVSFSFKIYPKSKQEFPILIEKLNYLIGLCYPSISSNSRMKTPFMNLTLGDMFVDAPGILKTVAITVEDNTTWEMDEGLQFPKHISVSCQYRYIGSGVPSGTSGDHYGGIRPFEVNNPTAEDIFNKYINFDINHDGTLIDQGAAYVDEKLGITKGIENLKDKVSSWF